MLFSWVSYAQLYAGYALSSVEGRVAMEFFDLSEASQAKKYVIIFLLPNRVDCFLVYILFSTLLDFSL